MTLLLALLSAAIVFLVSATTVIFIIGPVLLLQPRRRRKDFYHAINHPLTPRDLGLQYEEINVIARDGTKLNGWLVKAGHSAKGTILFLHGVGDCKIAGVPYARLFVDHGFNTFLYDSRRHGESEGTFCTYGYYERHDVIDIIDYLRSRTDVVLRTVGIFGTSMGAAVAIQAAAIDKRIVAIVAENSFATLRSIFDDYQKRMTKLPFHYLRNIVIKRSELMAKFKANDVSPLDAVKQIHLPILFIYGKKDRHINHQYSIMLHHNAEMPKELFPIENAAHNDTWQVAGKPYEQKLVEFFKQNLQ